MQISQSKRLGIVEKLLQKHDVTFSDDFLCNFNVFAKLPNIAVASFIPYVNFSLTIIAPPNAIV